MRRYSAQPQLIAGIDIGSTALRIAVGNVAESEDGGPRVHMMGAVSVPSEGIENGMITSIDETVSSLSNALEQVERLTGVPIDHAWVGIAGPHILSQKNKGIVAVAKPDGEISDEDVERVVEAARTIAPPLNYEILHVLPSSYAVDSQTGINDPVGMTGVRLEVDAHIIYVAMAHMKHITRAVYRTGIDIDDLVLSILATGSIVTTDRQKEIGAAVVAIGGSTTNVVVYEDGDVAHIATIPIGSEHITKDIAIGLRTSIDVAERIKIEYGYCLSKCISKKERVSLQTMGDKSTEEVKLSYISEIVEARAAEILEKVDAELARVSLSGLLPAGVVFTGGGAKIHGLCDLSKEVLRLPSTIGYPLNIQSITDKTSDTAYATAFGLVAWGAQLTKGRKRRDLRFNSASKAIQKLQSVWRSLIP